MISFISITGVILLLLVWTTIYENTALAFVAFTLMIILVLAAIYVLIARTLFRLNMWIPYPLIDRGERMNIEVETTQNGLFTPYKIVYLFDIENGYSHETIHIRQMHKLGYVFNQAGNYNVILRQVRLYDYTGIFYSTKKINISKNVCVLPKVTTISEEAVELINQQFMNLANQNSISRELDYSDITDLSEFRSGDQLKNVHWKLSAKYEKLIVAKRGTPDASDLVVLLDINLDRDKKLISEYLDKLVSISFLLITLKIKHYLSWYSSKENDVTRVFVANEDDLNGFIVSFLCDSIMSADEAIDDIYFERYKTEQGMHKIIVKGNGEKDRQSEAIVAIVDGMEVVL